MKTKYSFLKVIVSLTLLAGLLLTAAGVRAASIKSNPGQAVQLAHLPAVTALRIVVVGSKPPVLVQQGEARGDDLGKEIQPNDDRGGLQVGNPTATVEPGDDQALEEKQADIDHEDEITSTLANPVTGTAKLDNDENDDRGQADEIEANSGKNEAGDDQVVTPTLQSSKNIEFTGLLTAMQGEVWTVNKHGEDHAVLSNPTASSAEVSDQQDKNQRTQIISTQTPADQNLEGQNGQNQGREDHGGRDGGGDNGGHGGRDDGSGHH